MAAVSIANSPRTLSSMSGRRVPLSNNPNAANSPYRAVAAAPKQKRSYATVQREEAYGQPPPAKKQMLKANQTGFKTPIRQSVASFAESRIVARKSTATTSNNFTRKLEASRVKLSQPSQSAADNEVSLKNLETIRQWQRHYRKVFPKCVFYFESISEDLRIRFSKQVVALGAREEKFFSNAVTHVVTSRAIPPGVDDVENAEAASSKGPHSQSANTDTINPLLLDRSSEPSSAQLELRPMRSKFTFEVPGRKAASVLQEVDVRRQQGRNVDVLHRARTLGIKIWALEKLERMMVTMFETDTGLQAPHGHNTRSNSTQSSVVTMPRSTRQTDLSQLLRNERINGPSDRDPTVAVKEMVIFKGPFIYIHDIDEKQKPIMVREYPKVSNKESGDWPQFRSVSNGRCPFIEEVDEDDRREAKRDLANQQKHREREKSATPQDRPKVEETCRMQPPKASTGTRVIARREDGTARRAAVPAAAQPTCFEMAAPPMEREHSSKGPQNAFVSRAGQGRMLGGEPVASGLQRSAITSAIRSQMISSTAAAPGAKAGTSKEVHGLQRKVLEKNSGSVSLGQASSHRMTDFHAVVKEDSSTRGGRRGNRKLELIAEDECPREGDPAKEAEQARPLAKGEEKKKVERRDPKVGYCENCMESFPNFHEHIVSRKHRKFAENNDNWHELDQLLSQLARPGRDADYY